MHRLCLFLVALTLAAQPRPNPAEVLFTQNCATCHLTSSTGTAANERIPARDALAKMTPESIFRALTSGAMRTQAAGLTEPNKRALAELLSGGRLNVAQVASAASMPNQCPAPAQPWRPSNASEPSWNGWSGRGNANARFQPAAGITAATVPGLKLKWAFGFPGVSQVYGQPAVTGGRVFLGVDSGLVYSLDAKTGCVHWSFAAGAGVRTSINVETVNRRALAFLGDAQGNAYALDAATGEQVWKTQVDAHPTARITGAPTFHDGRLYVPMASGEEGTAGSGTYPCCTFRGSVSALDAATGRVIWKTYMMDEAKPTKKTASGVQLHGPSGAGIWSPPTIDAARGLVYVATGDAYSNPAPETTDAIVAVEMATGKIAWVKQLLAGDAWTIACFQQPKRETCPDNDGPDHDFGAPGILVNLPAERGLAARTLLVAPQKSGIVWALDPDKRGEIVWKTAVTSDTTSFGGKLVFGGAADARVFYVGLTKGGIAAVQLRDGERLWFADIKPAPDVARYVSQDGAVTAIPGVLFAGGWDGVIRALDTTNGRVIWSYDTRQPVETVNGVAAKGGSLGQPGPTVAGGMLFTGSGYIGVQGGMPGNLLLAFE